MDFKTAGESHGKALTGIISDYPSGVPVDVRFIDLQLSRRQKGYGRGGRMSIESDAVEIISGIRKNHSTGSPISFLIKNRDWKNWKEIMAAFPEKVKIQTEQILLDPRPGHADFPGMLKYHLGTIRDVIERSSARETAARVCIGSFAMMALNIFGIGIKSYVDSIGGIKLDSVPDIKDSKIWKKIEDSPVRCPDSEKAKKMIDAIDNAKKNGDSIGGSFRVVADGLFPGIGSFTEWETRLDARMAYAVMSIPAIKAVEIGNGIHSGSKTGLDFHDEIYYKPQKGFYRKTNNAGGIEGGMTNGEDIIIGAVMKPIPTTTKGLRTVNILNKDESVSLKERSDTCAVPSASIVGEAMVAIELFNAIQKKFGSDNINEIKQHIENYKHYLKNI